VTPVKYFDHWKMWVRIRKLLRYHLNLANDSVQYMRADLRWAFEKWRRCDKERA
jgi:hypothetical protein